MFSVVHLNGIFIRKTQNYCFVYIKYSMQMKICVAKHTELNVYVFEAADFILVTVFMHRVSDWCYIYVFGQNCVLTEREI